MTPDEKTTLSLLSAIEELAGLTKELLIELSQYRVVDEEEKQLEEFIERMNKRL